MASNRAFSGTVQAGVAVLCGVAGTAAGEASDGNILCTPKGTEFSTSPGWPSADSMMRAICTEREKVLPSKKM